MKNKNLFKKLVFLTVLSLCTMSSYAQTRTEKWNEWSKRYEYFNSRGTLVGYKIYNYYQRQWEYFDLSQNDNSRNPQRATSVDYGIQVAGMLQARYDNNMAEIRVIINDYLEMARQNIREAPNKINEEAWINVVYDFQTKCVDKFYKNPGDLSKRARVLYIKSWISDSYYICVQNYVLKK